MKKKSKQTRQFRALLKILLITGLVIYICKYKLDLKEPSEAVNPTTSNYFNIVSAVNNLDEPVVIPGQTLVNNANGYTHTFTTLNDIYKKTYIEYKQDLNASWSENAYWGGTMAENGCGITALAIIASGYGSNLTPEDFRTQYYPHLDSSKIAKSLHSLDIECSDFYFSSIYFTENYIASWLKSNRPVLICVDSKTPNRWTAASHYMVLLDVDENGLFYLSNPNGEDDTEKASGWYKPDDILPFVVKTLFIESY